ncbi:MAG: hypothetical protein IJE65_02695, partial [Clostridia bacterium]|nr:hypothetical protein [Clostridia bacterium]
MFDNLSHIKNKHGRGRACFLWQGQKDSPVCDARNSLTLSFARRISTAAPAFGSLLPLSRRSPTRPTTRSACRVFDNLSHIKNKHGRLPVV